MRVELYIRGGFFKEWKFEMVEFYEPQCPVVHDERKLLFDRVMGSCVKEVDPIILAMPHQFELIVPARIQPADISADEYEEFLPVVIEIENRLNLREKYGSSEISDLQEVQEWEGVHEVE